MYQCPRPLSQRGQLVQASMLDAVDQGAQRPEEERGARHTSRRGIAHYTLLRKVFGGGVSPAPPRFIRIVGGCTPDMSRPSPLHRSSRPHRRSERCMNPLTRNPAPTAPLAPCPAGGGRCTERPAIVITPMPLPFPRAPCGNGLSGSFSHSTLDVTGLAC